MPSAIGRLRESPVNHRTPFLVALRARQKFLNDWFQTHPSQPPPSRISFAYNDVVTREVADRTPNDSFTSIILPFKDDQWFLDSYISSYGRLRIGQLFQDLDLLSGVIANKHCSPAQPVIVTASVDRILMLKRLDDVSHHNVVLWGSVTWTGRSSMEITIHAATTARENQAKPPTREEVENDETFLVANFTFVARDPDTNKAFPINRLVPQTDVDHQQFVLAEKYNLRKKSEAQRTALVKSPPTAEESRIIHELWMQNVEFSNNPEKRPETTVPMDKTQVQSANFMQPQYRNRHSYMVFGGYMMRQAFELAFACAAAFSHSQPRFVSLDTVTFKSPVPVGSVLYLDASVVYTERTRRAISDVDSAPQVCEGMLIQVRVASTVQDLGHDGTKNAGEFYFSYFVHGSSRTVLPQSYDDMMKYIEGRRRSIDITQYIHDMHDPDAVEATE